MFDLPQKKKILLDVSSHPELFHDVDDDNDDDDDANENWERWFAEGGRHLGLSFDVFCGRPALV